MKQDKTITTISKRKSWCAVSVQRSVSEAARKYVKNMELTLSSLSVDFAAQLLNGSAGVIPTSARVAISGNARATT